MKLTGSQIFVESLKAEGKIRYYSGKSELIRLGEFDDVDICLTTHAHMVANADCDSRLGISP